jgi:hypothetical protein
LTKFKNFQLNFFMQLHSVISSELQQSHCRKSDFEILGTELLTSTPVSHRKVVSMANPNDEQSAPPN